MATLTGFATGGIAAAVLYPQTEDAAVNTLKTIRASHLPYVLLGNGSNVLAPDEDFDGVIVATTELKDIRVEENRIFAASGASLSRMALVAMKAGLGGLEFAYGIPGTLGGALYMNAGAYGGEMKDVVTSVRVLDENGRITEIAARDLAFGYRESRFQHEPAFILSGTLTLKPANKENIRAQMDTLMAKRTASQPLNLPSAGSTFRRPKNGYAAQLIDEAGLKGFSVGGAAVSEKHAGFVVNRGNATSRDVLAVISHVKETVLARSGITLCREVVLLSELIRQG